MSAQRKIVHVVGESSKNDAPTLGGKGAGLARLHALGIRVPPAFTVSTTMSRAYNETGGRLPKRLDWQLQDGLKKLERLTGKTFGDPAKPLLVSVRSGAQVSMPGMMDTILNLGMTDAVAEQMSKVDPDFVQRIFHKYAGHEDPQLQLAAAIRAVCNSWESERAILYRNAHKIPHALGTAVTVQAMVFGNRDDRSATGVVFSRNVATGAKGLYGEFLVNAQGEELVAGTKTPRPIAEMRSWNGALYEELAAIAQKLERAYDDVVDIEFTVESGVLYILQVRAAKRTPLAAATIAVHFEWERRWTKETATKRLSENEMNALRGQSFEPTAWATAVERDLWRTGLAASPGAAVGRIAYTSAQAEEYKKSGLSAVLVRHDTSPADLAGMLASVAIITNVGGTTSHAAVVARSLGIPAVVGSCLDLCDTLIEGTVVSVNGTTGQVVIGEVRMTDAPKTKEVNILLRWRYGTEIQFPKPAIAQRYFQESADLRKLIADFYLTEAMARETSGTPLAKAAHDLKKRVHAETAERVATYLIVAIAGEMQHVYARNTQVEALAAAHAFGVLKDTMGGHRPTQEKVMSTLANNGEKQIAFLEFAMHCFNDLYWNGSYGGKKWGAIAEAALQFLKGELNHTVFTDHAFDLEHNSGSVFGKHPMITGREYGQEMLEEKKNTTSLKELHLKYAGRLCHGTRISAEIAALYQRMPKEGN